MAKDPDISTHLHQPQVLGIDLGERRLLGRFTQDGTCSLDCGNSTGDTSSCCGRNGGGDRPTDSAQQSIAIGVGTPGPADAGGELPE